MPRPYSGDLRERAIEEVRSGASRREVAERFDVSPSSVINWVRRWRETGSAAAKPSGGSVSRLENFGKLCEMVFEADCGAAVTKCTFTGESPCARREFRDMLLNTSSGLKLSGGTHGAH